MYPTQTPKANCTTPRTDVGKEVCKSGQMASRVKCNAPAMRMLMKGHFRVLTSIRLSFAEWGPIEQACISTTDVILHEKDQSAVGEGTKKQPSGPTAPSCAVPPKA